MYKGSKSGIIQGMEQVHDDLSAVDESPDAFDDNFFDQWLDRSGHAVFEKISSGESVRTEEMMILVLRSQAGISRRLEGEFRREMKVLREEFKALRRDMDWRFAEMREDTNGVFSTVKWMIALCSGVIVTLITLYRFLR